MIIQKNLINTLIYLKKLLLMILLN